MANYQQLKAAIDQVIKANGQKEITGPVLNDTLKAMVNSLGAGYQFRGVATPSTNPGTPDQNVFYLAGKAGTYTNFNSIVLPDGVSILKWNGNWSSETVLAGDGVFDISAFKATGGTLATFADLSAALDGGNNIPDGLQKGGMSVKFVRSSDNKYVQYRLMSDTFNTTPANWQGVDDEPTAGSNNLVKSGAVYNVLKNSKDIKGLIELKNGYIERNGTITNYATWYYGTYTLNAGETITVSVNASNYPSLGIATNGAEIGDVVTVVDGNSYTATEQTVMVISVGTGINSAIITSAGNIFENADNFPEFDSHNIVSSNGAANSINKVRIDGRLTQERNIFINKSLSNAFNTQLGGHNDDKIVVTLIDSDGVVKSDKTFVLYHGAAQGGVRYTELPANTPVEVTLTNDVESFTLYSGKTWIEKSGNVRLKIEFLHESYAKQTDFSVLKEKVDAIDTLYDDDFSVQVVPNVTGINKRYDINGKYRHIVISVSNGQYLPSDGLIIYGNNVGYAYIIGKCKHGETREFIVSENVNTIIIFANEAFIRATGTVNVNIELYSELLYDVTILGKELKETRIETELSYNNVLSVDSTQSKSYDTGISLNMGQEMLLTLVDDDNIITAETLPLYFNSTSGSYINISPNVPKLITVSELTNLILYVSSSWVSGSGNITLHVDYAKTSNIIDVVLPSKVYGYVGGEFNIYNENVAFITQKDRYYVFWEINDISDYKVYSDRLELIPTTQMIGTHTITCFVKDKYNSITVYKKQITFEIIANQSVSNKKVLFIGDSLTNAGYYPHFIEYLSNNGIQSIGTRETEVWSSFVEGRKDIVHHEGRGGWSAQDYTRTYPNYRTNYDNPFWDGNKFDFGYYMSEQGYSRPDAVFLNLGTNEVEALDKQVEAIKIMINSIHDYDSTIPVFVHLITPPATQDGWAYTGDGSSGYSDSNLFDMNARAERKRYIEEFDNKITNVFISPAYFNLDRFNDYATVEEQLSQRNPKMVVRQANNVHPSRYGYYKLADVYYADLMNILS